MQKEKIIHKINGKEYLLVEFIYTESSKNKKQMKKLINLGGIYQGIKNIDRGSLLSNTFAIVKILIPTSKIEEYKKIANKYLIMED